VTYFYLFMREVIKFYRLCNFLSLDVVAGAVVSSLFFASIFEVTPSIPSLISLGLTVWIIYTVDRLLDIRDVKGEASSGRHRFHQRNQKTLMRWLWLAIIIDMVVVFFMPVAIIKHGMFLSVVVTIYTALRRRLSISKELLVAVLYTAGVVLPSWPVNQLGFDQYLFIILFFLIALINLILFSWYEKEGDLMDKQNSVATIIDERAILYILTGLFIIIFLIFGCMVFQPPRFFILLVFVAMTAILLIIFLHKNFFAVNDYYRLLGDAVFFLPLIYVLS
jgi:4-hydroxybenzoate polyprenyltransferase